MFKNYLIAALNNLLINRLYSIINIVGLAVGLMACILITLYVQDELSYDEQWEKSQQIYRVNQETEFPGSVLSRGAFTAMPILPTLLNHFPSEIETGSRLRFEPDVDIQVDGTAYTEQFVRVDPEFSELFQLDMVLGSLEDTFADIYSIALSEELATRLFGSADPIGKTITVPSRFVFPAKDYTVNAVYRLPEGNTILRGDTRFGISSLVLLDDSNMPSAVNSWQNGILQTYVLLRDGVDSDAVNSQLPDYIDDYARYPQESIGNGTPSDFVRFSLQSITDMYLNPWTDIDRQNSGSTATVLVFSVVAALVLIIGCTNFMVLTTARSTNRAREVAMRKVMGAKRETLIIQFLGESVLITLFAILLGLVLLELLLPIYNSFTTKELALNYASPLTYLFLAGLVMLVGITGGVYPALVLSMYSPGDSLKAGQGKGIAGSTNARNLLVVLQFSISIALVVATALVFLQSRYASNNNLGFSQDNLLVVMDLPLTITASGLVGSDSYSVLKQEIDNLSAVTHSSFSYAKPGQGFTGGDVITPAATLLPVDSTNSEDSITVNLRTTPVDAGFFSTYQIGIVAGRDYDESYPNDQIVRISESNVDQVLQANLIINEAAVSHLGIPSAEEAIGRTLQGSHIAQFGATFNFTIVGVVADSLFHNARTESVPEMYPFDSSLGSNLTIKYDGEPQQVLASISAIWPTVMDSSVVFKTGIVEQLVSDQLADVQIQTVMMAGFSLLATTLACLGLLGMSTFIIDRRTREIGLRKVMGAKVKDIVRLLVWQFSKPVLLANLIAWPFIVAAMVRWLETFSNRIDSL